MPKIHHQRRYTLTKYNQLVLSTPQSDRVVIPGRFALGEDNQLSYLMSDDACLTAPYRLPRRIPFEGIWSLRDDHQIQFTLFETKEQEGGNAFVFKGTITAVTPRSLHYRFDEPPGRARGKVISLALKGRWQADEHNRLTFLAEKGSARYDRLTFKGVWETERNTLTYRYTQKSLATRENEEHSLQFKGFWTVNVQERITYILDYAGNSLFSFRVQRESGNLIGKHGTIKYRAGIGISRAHRPRISTVTLYGTWRFGKKSGLAFEMEYGAGDYRRMEFEAFLKLSEKDTITLGLKNPHGKDLGITVCFSRTFLQNNAEWFLRGSKSDRESRIEAGVSIPW